MNKRAVTIYALTDPRTNQVRYVGQTRQFRIRMGQHLRDTSKNHRCRWIRSLARSGLKPGIRVLAVVDEVEANDTEIRAIAFYRSTGTDLVNGTDGGDGANGYVPTPEARARMSRVKIGRKLSPEWCASLSAASLGKPKSESHRRNIALGKRAAMTPELREKLIKNNLARANAVKRQRLAATLPNQYLLPLSPEPK